MNNIAIFKINNIFSINAVSKSIAFKLVSNPNSLSLLKTYLQRTDARWKVSASCTISIKDVWSILESHVEDDQGADVRI